MTNTEKSGPDLRLAIADTDARAFDLEVSFLSLSLSLSGTGMPETSSIISLTGENHINNLQSI
jgi:hypothetical protein